MPELFAFPSQISRNQSMLPFLSFLIGGPNFTCYSLYRFCLICLRTLLYFFVLSLSPFSSNSILFSFDLKMGKSKLKAALQQIFPRPNLSPKIGSQFSRIHFSNLMTFRSMPYICEPLYLILYLLLAKVKIGPTLPTCQNVQYYSNTQFLQWLV